MATGNFRMSRRFCKSCNASKNCQRNGMVWGMGDLILVLLSFGVWVIFKLAFNALLNPWRCADCGART